MKENRRNVILDDLGCLTCDVHIDGLVFCGHVPVPAAERASVMGLAVANTQTAAVVLVCSPTAKFIYFHLIPVQACWEHP